MNRAMVLGWLCLILTLSESALAEAKDPTDLTVVVVRAGTLDWPEARLTAEAELAATGFKVLAHDSRATTPGRLIDDLRIAARMAPEVRGSVAVFRESGESRAYVWIPDRENLFQVDVPPESARMAAEVLSLRIVELLRVRLLDEPPKPAPPAARKRGLTAAWLAAGPWLAPGLERPVLDLGFAASFRLFEPIELDLAGHLSVLSGRAETSAGTLRFSTTAITLHGLYLAHESAHYGLAFGGGGGALLFDANATGHDPFVGRSQSAAAGLFSLRARAVARFGDLAFLLALEPGVTLPAIAAGADDSEVFRFGQPLLLVAAGVGWSQ